MSFLKCVRKWPKGRAPTARRAGPSVSASNTAAMSLAADFTVQKQWKALQMSRLIFTIHVWHCSSGFMPAKRFGKFPSLCPIFKMTPICSLIFFAPIRKRSGARVCDGRHQRTVRLNSAFAGRFLHKRRDGPSAVKIGRRPSGIERRIIYASRQRQYQMGFHDAA